MIEELIKHLQEKHDAFIGSLKDKETVANSKGFKQGLAWAIESAETIIRNKQAEEEFAREEEERHRLQNAYRCDEDGNCDGFPR
jgi:hypothetical protein